MLLLVLLVPFPSHSDLSVKGSEPKELWERHETVGAGAGARLRRQSEA